jgi:transposase-like protein/ribosomal protein L13E
MSKHECPYCPVKPESSGVRSNVIRNGFFKRKSDHRRIRRYRCKGCLRYFSLATSHPCFGQNKRQLNAKIRSLLCSGVSLRRIAMLLGISRRTVERKLKFLGGEALRENLIAQFSKFSSEHVQFDEMETFEHTKLKPLSIPLAVDKQTRRILGFSVAQMPAKGHLARLSRKRYGVRVDERRQKRIELLRSLQVSIHPFAQIESDQHPLYAQEIGRVLPLAQHRTHPGQRGSIVGQGELKKVRFDPLFSLNHTCAMLRANINRLFRRTWCTTKRRERLLDHIAIYVQYHNSALIT